MDFKFSLTPFLTPGKYLVDAERSGPRVRFAYPGYAGPRSREIVPDTFLRGKMKNVPDPFFPFWTAWLKSQVMSRGNDTILDCEVKIY